MQEFEDEDYLGGIKARRLLVEALRFPEVGKYFATRAIVELWDLHISLMLFLYQSLDQLTSIYKESWSEKEVIKVVIKGCPATSARTERS